MLDHDPASLWLRRYWAFLGFVPLVLAEAWLLELVVGRWSYPAILGALVLGGLTAWLALYLWSFLAARCLLAHFTETLRREEDAGGFPLPESWQPEADEDDDPYGLFRPE